MVRRNNRGKTSRTTVWKRRFVLTASVVFVAGVILAVRNYSGPQDAQARSPQRDVSERHTAHRPIAESTQAPAPVTNAQNQQIAASVNGQPITRQELADQCLQRFGTEVLESLVNKHLIWQECQSKGVEITSADVEAEITRLAGKFGLTASRWLTMLREERGITPQQYRQEIIWPTLALRSLAASQIVVTPVELQKAMEAEYGPRVKVRAITVTSRQQAEQLRAQALQAPDSFGDLAKKFSQDQSASVNGLIPPIRRHMGDEDIERAAFALQEGEISPIIQVANQFVILKCEQLMPETYIAERFRADAEARVRDRVEDQKLRSSAAQLFQQLQEKSNVVNVLNDPQLRAQMPGVAATINGQKVAIAQLAEECIQRHGREVLDGEINRKLLFQALKQKNLQVTEEDLNQEIARAADAYGFLKADGSPDIAAWLGEVTKEEGGNEEFYIRDVVWPSVALKKLVDQRVRVTEEDIQKGFISSFGPRVEALAVVLDSHRQAQKVWEMARGNPTDQFFGELAHQYSTDPVSRENFGRIPPIRQHGGRPELEKEAFALKAGELSGIIASEDRYVILRCTGHTTPVVGTLDDDVRQELTKDIREKKLRVAMAVEFDRLQTAATVENYLAGTFSSPSQQPGTATARAGSHASR